MRTIAIINQKGGCGKTTSAINLSSGLARRGFRTLLVDLDPQSHCAAGLGIPEDRLDLDISDALRLPADAALDTDRFVWTVSRGLDLLPSRMRLAGLEAARGGLADMPDPHTRLATVLDRVTKTIEAADPERRYDAVVIDCPPSIGLLSYNALAAADEVMIPVETSYFSLRGAGKQIQTARSVSRRVGRHPKVRLLATMYDPKLPLARDLLDDLRDRFGTGVIPIVIRQDAQVKEAASFGMPIESHDPESDAAQDYGSLCEWTIQHAEVERPEPGTDDRGAPGPSGSGRDPLFEAPGRQPFEKTLAAPTMSRAQELAMRASALAVRPASRTGRMLPPHRPVAIELSESEAPVVKEVPPSLHGCRAVAGGLLFVFPIRADEEPEVASVAVSGSFNGWDPKKGEMTRRGELGIFELRIDAVPGRYEYRLVVDGRWVCDPNNPDRVRNGLGGENSVAVVP